MRAWGQLLAAAISVSAAAGVVGACGSNGTRPDSSPSPARNPTSTTTAANSTVSTLGPLCPPPREAPSAAILTGLLPSAPAGFTQLPDTVSPDGPISVTQLAAGSNNPTRAMQVNAALGIEGGYRRSFERAADHAQLQVVVVVASCPAGAARFVGVSTPALVRFPVTNGVPGAVGEQSATTDAEGNRVQVIGAAVGRVTLTVELFTTSSSTSMVQSLAATAAAAVRLGEVRLPG